jgi:hypothetical protein
MSVKKLPPHAPLISRELLTRRVLLKCGAGIAVAAPAQALMPPNVRRVLAQGPPRRSSLADIKHVVLLMQESRSFDHMTKMTRLFPSRKACNSRVPSTRPTRPRRGNDSSELGTLVDCLEDALGGGGIFLADVLKNAGKVFRCGG